MKIIALYSIKGGVGKTATAVNLAHLAARGNSRTLLCDLDPQGAATYYFRIRPDRDFNRKKFLKGGKLLGQNIKGTDFDGLDVLPSDLSYRNLDLALDDLGSKEKFKEIFRPFRKEYDFIFLDCPPNLTRVSENVFCAADLLLVPCIPTTLSMMTFDKLLSFFKDKKISTAKLFAFYSMVESRKKLHLETVAGAGAAEPFFLASRVPYLADIEKMGVNREPVTSFAPTSRAARAYRALWEEVRRVMGK